MRSPFVSLTGDNTRWPSLNVPFLLPKSSSSTSLGLTISRACRRETVGASILTAASGSRYFFVRFGTRNGEPRAYLTWAGDDTDAQPATLLDVEVVGDRLVVESTPTRVPRT